MHKRILDKYPKFDYAQKCFRGINSNEFVRNVLNLGKNPMILEFESLGNKNRDKNILLYESKIVPFGGFFAHYRLVLDALYFSERFNLIPFIKYSTCTYCEDIKVNGTENPFEYYFEQVSEISEKEAYSSYNVFKFKPQHIKIAEELNNGLSYYTLDKYIDCMAEIQKKYIRLNHYVSPIISNDVTNVLNGKKSIGVHVRGTDFKCKFNRHPVLVNPTEYIYYIEDALSKYNFEQIFLATDENSTIELFKQRFGNKLVYFDDVFRADGGDTSIVFIDSKREQHKYLLGLEVLRDMITLANCDGLITGMSGVSISARITKASYDKKYEYMEIIDKGINENNFKLKKYKFYYEKYFELKKKE